MAAPDSQIELLVSELAQFTGDLDRWRHWLNKRLIYTPGVRHLAERGKAYWLLDAIAVWLRASEFSDAAAKDSRIGEIHFWRLDVAGDQSAILTARADTGEPPFIIQRVEYTDFPLPAQDLWCAFDGEHWTLMLPSEY